MTRRVLNRVTFFVFFALVAVGLSLLMFGVVWWGIYCLLAAVALLAAA